MAEATIAGSRRARLPAENEIAELLNRLQNDPVTLGAAPRVEQATQSAATSLLPTGAAPTVPRVETKRVGESIGPEPEEVESTLSSFFGNPKFILGTVAGLAILNSTSDNPAGMILDGMTAMGFAVGEQREREEGERAARVEEDRLALAEQRVETETFTAEQNAANQAIQRQLQARGIDEKALDRGLLQRYNQAILSQKNDQLKIRLATSLASIEAQWGIAELNAASRIKAAKIGATSRATDRTIALKRSVFETLREDYNNAQFNQSFTGTFDEFLDQNIPTLLKHYPWMKGLIEEVKKGGPLGIDTPAVSDAAEAAKKPEESLKEALKAVGASPNIQPDHFDITRGIKKLDPTATDKDIRAMSIPRRLTLLAEAGLVYNAGTKTFEPRTVPTAPEPDLLARARAKGGTPTTTAAEPTGPSLVPKAEPVTDVRRGILEANGLKPGDDVTMPDGTVWKWSEDGNTLIFVK